MTTPTSATRVPVPPITRHCSILYRGGAQPIDIPGWPTARFRVINHDMQDHNGYGVECLAYDKENAYRNHKLWIDPSEPHPLVILDVEDDNDPWSPLIFERMEKQRAAIAADPLWKHIVCVPYLGHARELLKIRSPSEAMKRADQLRAFAIRFVGVAPCIYFDLGDEANPFASDRTAWSMQVQMMRLWGKITLMKPLYPVVWHYNKVARRICTPAEWKCQLDACTGPNVKGVVWWGEADGNDHRGMDSDPRTLSAFVAQLGATP